MRRGAELRDGGALSDVDGCIPLRGMTAMPVCGGKCARTKRGRLWHDYGMIMARLWRDYEDVGTTDVPACVLAGASATNSVVPTVPGHQAWSVAVYARG